MGNQRNETVEDDVDAFDDAGEVRVAVGKGCMSVVRRDAVGGVGGAEAAGGVHRWCLGWVVFCI